MYSRPALLRPVVAEEPPVVGGSLFSSRGRQGSVRRRGLLWRCPRAKKGDGERLTCARWALTTPVPSRLSSVAGVVIAFACLRLWHGGPQGAIVFGGRLGFSGRGGHRRGPLADSDCVACFVCGRRGRCLYLSPAVARLAARGYRVRRLAEVRWGVGGCRHGPLADEVVRILSSVAGAAVVFACLRLPFGVLWGATVFGSRLGFVRGRGRR